MFDGSLGIRRNTIVLPAGYRLVSCNVPVMPTPDGRVQVRFMNFSAAAAPLVIGDELVWDRAFGRPRDTVVLPAAWTVVASSIPSQISEDAEGRQRLYFENPRPDDIQVLIRARRIR